MATNRRIWRYAILVAGTVLASSALFLDVNNRTRAHEGAERVIPMTVKRFEYSPREIHLKKGDPVVYEITSLDVPHGFNLPDFKVRADVIPGQLARVRVLPDKVGVFTFRCDVFCGSRHEDLDGTIVVSE